MGRAFGFAVSVYPKTEVSGASVSGACNGRVEYFCCAVKIGVIGTELIFKGKGFIVEALLPVTAVSVNACPVVIEPAVIIKNAVKCDRLCSFACFFLVNAVFGCANVA